MIDNKFLRSSGNDDGIAIPESSFNLGLSFCLLPSSYVCCSYVCLCLCLPLSVSLSPLFCLYVSVSVCLSLNRWILLKSMYAFLSIFTPVCLPLCPCVCLCHCLSLLSYVSPSVSFSLLSVYLSLLPLSPSCLSFPSLLSVSVSLSLSCLSYLLEYVYLSPSVSVRQPSHASLSVLSVCMPVYGSILLHFCLALNPRNSNLEIPSARQKLKVEGPFLEGLKIKRIMAGSLMLKGRNQLDFTLQLTRPRHAI